MTLHILQCPGCKRYTIKDKCPNCGGAPIQVIPAKYSPEDPYGKYRREVKKDALKDKGLL
ncbi:MAG: RNA-protein complex protein Nop10 [Candidatus Woesearchaeota archaeon]